MTAAVPPRNIDWSAAFALAARAGPHELVRALRTAMETEFAAFTEKYDALLARQRAECDAALAASRATCNEILAQQRADYDMDLARQRTEFERRFDALKHELGPVIVTLRRELAAARAEIDRLRAAQPAH